MLGSSILVGNISVASHIADRVLISNASGIVSSSTTAQQLSYLDAASSIQAQLSALEQVDTALNAAKQDVILADHLDITHVAGLQDNIDLISTKQNTIQNNDLVISQWTWFVYLTIFFIKLLKEEKMQGMIGILIGISMTSHIRQ